VLVTKVGVVGLDLCLSAPAAGAAGKRTLRQITVSGSGYERGLQQRQHSRAFHEQR
jgi:hypothetical protein